VDEAAENRNYLAQRMTDEINEIIRVLQLTTYDEDEWEADNLTCMKKAQVFIIIYDHLFTLYFNS
jgi:vinculin